MRLLRFAGADPYLDLCHCPWAVWEAHASSLIQSCKACMLRGQMTDPYLNLYRGLVPPLLGTIDFTPLLGFFILQYLSGVLESGASESEVDEWW